MRALKKFLPILAALACAALIDAAPTPPTLAPNTYIPPAQYCALLGHLSTLCPVLPGNIGPDPELFVHRFGYNGLVGAAPTAFANDVETPFDNLSWQTFVALNWTAGKEKRPPAEGLKGDGARVWQSYARVASVFGQSRVQANCHPLLGEQVFSIASNGDGSPATRNEEYVQAATGDPAIDVDGNWTLYERRVNGIEIAYLRAPSGHSEWNLTNLPGQARFVADKQVVNFPAIGDNGAPNGAIEVKAAWRILDRAKHAANAKTYYIIRAMLAVAPDLVDRGPTGVVAPICTEVELGLVAMHIIQKNPVIVPPPGIKTVPLKPEWFWTTFEHVDNAPLAAAPCDVTDPAACKNINQTACPVAPLPPGAHYAYYNPAAASLPTNIKITLPTGVNFHWNPVPPYAKAYLNKGAGSQISRCWKIYGPTQLLNAQWQKQLRAVGSVFANYMLIGTQWGAGLDGLNIGPRDAAPNYLSNTLLETYLQTFNQPNGAGVGSCVSCHAGATLTANVNVSADLSFLPSLVNPLLLRRKPATPIPH